MSTRRITVCLDDQLRELAEYLTAEKEPYLRRHRLLRLAIRQGLTAFRDHPELIEARMRDETTHSV